MRYALAFSLLATGLSTAQDTSVTASRGSTDDVPNIPTTTATVEDPNLSYITEPFPTTSPALTLTALPTISTITNHVGPSTLPLTGFGPGPVCNGTTTVTVQGEPLFTIQTDTRLGQGCTTTVYASSAGNSSTTVTTAIGPGFNSTTIVSVVPTGSSSSASSGAGMSTETVPASSSGGGSSPQTSSTASQSPAATQSGSPANRVAMGGEAIALVAVGAFVALM